MIKFNKNRKRAEKMKDIPLGPYCYHGGRGDASYRPCPFQSYRLTNRGIRAKKWPNEYCKFLHTYLDIQDECKDCGIQMDDKSDLEEQELQNMKGDINL